MQKFCRLNLFLNHFSSVAFVSFFPSQPHKNNKKSSQHAHHDKEDVSKTTSHATPVKANTGKLAIKN
jgi:hypothetical protein